MNRQKLTKRAVDAAPVPSEGEARIWDTELSGFCLRVYSTGRKVYAVKYRVAGRQRWFTIGEHGNPWTTDQARDDAGRVLLEASRGHDPAAVKRVRDDLTVTALIDRYLADDGGRAAKPGKREVSWRQDESNLKRHVKPLLGRRLASGITKADLSRMVAQIKAGETAAVEKTRARGKAIVKGGDGTAERTYSTLRAVFSWAVSEGYLKGPSPFAAVRQRDLFPVRLSVERFLSDKQAADLLGALDALEAEGEISARHGAIFRLLLATGARRREIAGLRWSEVDFERGQLVLPPARTKAGGKTGERRIALNSFALRVLRDLEKAKERGPFVFPAARGASGHTTAEGKIWREKVLPRAGLPGVRIHDLRHSFASFALADGASLALIGKALGHASSRTTERYAKLADDPLKAMAERVGSRFGSAEGAK